MLTRHHEYDMIVRIKRQAEDFGRLHHPNLLPILSMGICGIRLYVVMPYCTLGTIERLRGEVAEGIPLIYGLALFVVVRSLGQRFLVINIEVMPNTN